MNKSRHLLAIALLLALPVASLPVRPVRAQEAAATTEAKATLTVKFTNLRNNKGILRVLLFNQEKGYPDSDKAAIAAQNIDLSKVMTPGAKEVTITFPDLTPGTYALAAHHDANGNGKLDTYWYGKPKEGVAASNNPRPKMRAARFSEAKFDLSSPGKSIDVSIWYP